MAEGPPTELDQLLAAVQASVHYRQVSPALIRSIGGRELHARRSLKEATKATKNALHQVYGAFLPPKPPYERWLAQLETARELDACRAVAEHTPDRVDSTTPAPAPAPGIAHSGNQAWHQTCSAIMANHASTAERIPTLAAFYASALAELPPINSVLDLGCGLNPLAIPWMGLVPGASYRCCDIDAALIGFLSRTFALAGIDGHAEVRDLVTEPPRQPADLALVLKLLPTLEAIQRDSGPALLDALQARYLLVSFPARSLGGRTSGLAAQHTSRFLALADMRGWTIRQMAFPAEVAFLVDRG